MTRNTTHTLLILSYLSSSCLTSVLTDYFPHLCPGLVGRLSAQEVVGQEAGKGQVPGVTSKTEFLRMRVNDVGAESQSEPIALETAVVTYEVAPNGGRVPSAGATVDLIGAVHIGEASYYQELNRLFDRYDVLLYELVAPEGTVIPQGGKRDGGGFNPVAMLQDSAKNMLGLESQLELIDYTKTHMVRADMTPTQMADKMAERGDTVLTLALSSITETMRQQNLAQRNGAKSSVATELEELGLVDMLGNPLKMKRALASQFAQTGSLDQTLGGPLNQLLIVDRNAAALKVLQKQLAAGKKRIGIFYGAAHLEDFEQHLLEDFGLQKTRQQWLTAWDLTTAAEPQLSQPASLLLNLLKGLE